MIQPPVLQFGSYTVWEFTPIVRYEYLIFLNYNFHSCIFKFVMYPGISKRGAKRRVWRFRSPLHHRGYVQTEIFRMLYQGNAPSLSERSINQTIQQ
jgi:hypothetical protein